jgi:3-carboxy-cis,cis-muconate cycloisomerase
MMHLYQGIFYDEHVSRLFSAEKVIQYMLRFEGALAQAQAKHGVIPALVASVIESCCQADFINKEHLIKDAALGGNLAIPLVKQLTARVKEKDAEAAKYIHFGATSQDVIDTALMMQWKEACFLIAEHLEQLIEQLISLIRAHPDTVMIGRSFLQQARPITFGFKVSGWLDPLLRSQQSMQEMLKKGFMLQLGGAVGTLSGMHEKGRQVSATMGELLYLNNPGHSWHTQRDYVMRIATTLSILTGNIGKIAKDISLLMQTEIAEVMEPAAAGKGGSSTMPHKRNPVGCVAILANTARIPGLIATLFSCMLQDHERATGLWHAEWETMAEIVQLTAGCVSKAVEITDGLEVRTEQMLHNLELTKGLIYAENVSLALAEKIGKQEAHALIEAYSKEALANNIHLRELLLSKPNITQQLSTAQIESLFDPAESIGLCKELVNQVLKNHSSDSSIA